MKLILTFLVLILVATNAHSKCLQKGEEGLPQISFKAFKTALKVGVPGSFTQVTWAGASEAESLRELLLSQSLTITPTSVETKNPSRNTNISEAFFSNFLGDKMIHLKVHKVFKSKILLEISMNKVKRLIPIKYTFKDSSFNGRGYLDLLDFKLEGALDSLTKRCFALHEGKTWSDIEIEVHHQLKGCAK